jgi:hypothetical protein
MEIFNEVFLPNGIFCVDNYSNNIFIRSIKQFQFCILAEASMNDAEF